MFKFQMPHATALKPCVTSISLILNDCHIIIFLVGLYLILIVIIKQSNKT